MIRRISNSLSRAPKTVLVLISFILVLLISALDYLSGYEMSFNIFYLIPVGLTAWYVGRYTSIGMAVGSAVICQLMNKLAGEVFSNPLIPVWNATVRIVIFAIFTLLLYKLRVALQREQRMARIDALTGIMNRRACYEEFTKELLRARRYQRPLTIAYIDIDNFKEVNDRFGHRVGDTLLRTIADTLRSSIRGTDTVARLGGDEFALLFPETDSMGAQKVLTEIHDHLQRAMDRNGWSATFSIGAIICLAPSTTLEDILGKVDRLMYTIKQTSKNAVRLETHPC